MAALSPDESQRRHRSRRLARNLVLGVAAVGLPLAYRRWRQSRFAELPLPAWGRGETYTWRGRSIAVQRIGQGPPIVLVHGFGPGHDSEHWRTLAELLATRWEVFAPDLPGWGRSAGVDVRLSPSLYTDFLHDLLVEVVRAPPVLVAAGTPGCYALRLAARGGVRALGLVAPRGLPRDSPPAVGHEALVRRLVELPVVGPTALQLSTSRQALHHHLAHELFAAPERADAGTVEHHFRSARQPGAEAALAAWLAGRLDGTVPEAPPPAELPIWLAWGRRAVSPPVENADLWLQRLPGAEVEVFEECGVLPHAEKPSRFALRLEEFLARAL